LIAVNPVDSRREVVTPTGGIIPAALAVRGQISRDGHPIYVSAGTEAVVTSRNSVLRVRESVRERNGPLENRNLQSLSPGPVLRIFVTRLRQLVVRRAVIVLMTRQDCALRWHCGWLDGWEKGLS